MNKSNAISLKQGLENFYQEHKEQLSHTKEDIPNEIRSFFRSHDIAHVLFDCDISMFGEGAVKIWTIYGTTLGFKDHIAEYKKANAFELAQNFSFGHSFKNIAKLLFSVPTLIYRAKKMKKLWPWNDFDAYLDRSLSEIRSEFNIRPLH